MTLVEIYREQGKFFVNIHPNKHPKRNFSLDCRIVRVRAMMMNYSSFESPKVYSICTSIEIKHTTTFNVHNVGSN